MASDLASSLASLLIVLAMIALRTLPVIIILAIAALAVYLCANLYHKLSGDSEAAKTANTRKAILNHATQHATQTQRS
jgi:cell division protein FtsW (lipid II flippase)